MSRKSQSFVSAAKARTSRVSAAIEKAMKIMEKEIADNDGIYPRNSGRVSLAEVCRRANVHPITLMGESHKGTTRVAILNWKEGLVSKLVKGKTAIRQAVTKRAVSAEESFQDIATQFQAMYQVEIPKRDAELEALRLRVKELEAENIRLLEQISHGRVVRFPRKKGA